MSETPEMDTLARELEDSPVNIETACEHLIDKGRSLEIDRNRWRSVAERLAKMKPTHPKHCICVSCKNWDEAIRAFDSLRKEGEDV